MPSAARPGQRPERHRQAIQRDDLAMAGRRSAATGGSRGRPGPRGKL